MTAENLTVTCKHRRRCILAPSPKGGGIRIQHAGPGDTALCDSERFDVRREYAATREGAHAELIRLDCLARAALDENPEGTPRWMST